MKWERALFLVATMVVAFALNSGFLRVEHYSTQKILAMNDIASIKLGYERTPNLMVDGLKWWHGEWIQDGIHAFRPISSYLYWCETYLWLHQGFIWPAWIGFGLFVINCLLSGVLGWQLTGSKICSIGASLLATTVRLNNTGHPSEWLGWYPVHQDLMMNAFMLGAVASFYQWFSTAEKKWLPVSWGLFILGSLSKEHVYIFPLFAGVIVLFGCYRKKNAVSPALAWANVLGMIGLVAGLMIYRGLVIVHPRNPTLKWNQLVYKPVIFIFPEFARYMFQRVQISQGKYRDIFLSKESWLPGLSLMIFLGITCGSKLRQKYPISRWLSLPVMVSAILIVIGVFLGFFGPDSDMPGAVNSFSQRMMIAVMRIFDHPFAQSELRDIIWMTVTFFLLQLLWRFRKSEPSLECFAFLVIAYLPVLDYIGWHYTAPAWFIWSVYWSVIWKLIWISSAPILSARLPWGNKKFS